MKEVLQRISGMVLLAAISLTDGISFMAAYLFLMAGVIYFISNINEKYTTMLRSGIYCVIMAMPGISMAFDNFVKTIVFCTIIAMIVTYYLLESKYGKRQEFL